MLPATTTIEIVLRGGPRADHDKKSYGAPGSGHILRHTIHPNHPNTVTNLENIGIRTIF